MSQEQANNGLPAIEVLEAALDVTYSWGYQDTRQQLRDLYKKATRSQWISEETLPWDTDVDMEKPSAPPEMFPLYGSDIYNKLTERELTRLYHETNAWTLSQFLHGELTEHIESCLHQLSDNFPGFHFETIVDESGWGAMISRDDLSLNKGRRDSLYSRLKMTISPHSKYHVLDLKAKGAVRNQENFSRNHYELLKDADLDSFRQLIEQWTLDYAEQYAASGG